MLEALLGGIRVMLSPCLLSDDMRMSMNDVGLRMLNLPASKSVVYDDPCDRISLPVKPLVVLDDCEVHRYEHP